MCSFYVEVVRSQVGLQGREPCIQAPAEAVGHLRRARLNPPLGACWLSANLTGEAVEQVGELGLCGGGDVSCEVAEHW